MRWYLWQGNFFHKKKQAGAACGIETVFSAIAAAKIFKTLS
jgi:hypothetical protein